METTAADARSAAATRAVRRESLSHARSRGGRPTCAGGARCGLRCRTAHRRMDRTLARSRPTARRCQRARRTALRARRPRMGLLRRIDSAEQLRRIRRGHEIESLRRCRRAGLAGCLRARAAVSMSARGRRPSRRPPSCPRACAPCGGGIGRPRHGSWCRGPQDVPPIRRGKPAAVMWLGLALGGEGLEVVLAVQQGGGRAERGDDRAAGRAPTRTAGGTARPKRRRCRCRSDSGGTIALFRA